MKRYVLTGCVIAIGIFFPSILSAQNVLKASGHPSGKPIMWQEGEQIVGPAQEFAKRLFSQLDVSVEFPYVGPWARVLKELEYGKLDALIACYENEQRKTFMVFTDPYADDPVGIFVPRGKVFPFVGIQDLYGKRGTYVNGQTFGKQFEEHKDHLTLETRPDITQCLNILVFRDFDYLICNAYQGQLEAAELGLSDKIELLPTYLSTEGLRFGFSKHSAFLKYLPDVNREIALMREQQLFDQLVTSYIQKLTQQ